VFRSYAPGLGPPSAIASAVPRISTVWECQGSVDARSSIAIVTYGFARAFRNFLVRSIWRPPTAIVPSSVLIDD
jgi:hypothetical protein